MLKKKKVLSSIYLFNLYAYTFVSLCGVRMPQCSCAGTRGQLDKDSSLFPLCGSLA